MKVQHSDSKVNKLRGSDSRTPISSDTKMKISDEDVLTPANDEDAGGEQKSDDWKLQVFMSTVLDRMEKLNASVQNIEMSQVALKYNFEQQQESIDNALATIVDENTASAELMSRRLSRIEEVEPAVAANANNVFREPEQQTESSFLAQSPSPAQPFATPVLVSRRGSIVPHVSSNATNNNTTPVQVVYTKTAVVRNESDKMRKATIKAYLYIKERYDELKSQHPDDLTLTLISLVGQVVILELANNERLLDTEISRMPDFDHNIFYRLSDDLVIKIFARYFKPSSRIDFGEKLYSTLRGSLKSSVVAWKFGIKDYHRALYPRMNELIYRMEETIRLLYKAKLEEDDYKYPAMVYGTIKEPGLFRHLVYCFGDFEKSFIQAMPLHEMSVKSITTTVEFFKLVKATNDGLARQSMNLEMAEQRLVIPAPLSELFPRVSINGEAQEPSDRRESIKNSNAQLKLFQTDVSRETNDTVDTGEDGGDLFYGRSNFPNKSNVSNSNVSNAYPKIYKDKPAERTLPCYKWAQHRSCPTGAACVWSHDDTVCREYAETQVTLLAESPYLHSKVKEAIVSVYPSAVAALAKAARPSVSFKTPTSQNVHGRTMLMESDESVDGVDANEMKLSDAKTGDY